MQHVQEQKNAMPAKIASIVNIVPGTIIHAESVSKRTP
jgi:hypothetical protein